MLKVYLSSVLIWLSFSIATKEEFLKNVDKLEKALNKTKMKKWSYTKTTFNYLLASFVPIFRFMVLIAKVNLVFNIEKVIEKIKKMEENNENND